MDESEDTDDELLAVKILQKLTEVQLIWQGI